VIGKYGHAAGGTIYERVVTADGSLDFVEVTRHQTKRDRKSDGTWAFYARHTLTCRMSDGVHDRWEPLTPTRTDEAHKFNRSDYLRVLPPTDPDYSRVYGMRRHPVTERAVRARLLQPAAPGLGSPQPDRHRADGCTRPERLGPPHLAARDRPTAVTAPSGCLTPPLHTRHHTWLNDARSRTRSQETSL